jgi:hypothetical protein
MPTRNAATIDDFILDLSSVPPVSPKQLVAARVAASVTRTALCARRRQFKLGHRRLSSEQTDCAPRSSGEIARNCQPLASIGDAAEPPAVIGDDKRGPAINAGCQTNRDRADNPSMHAVFHSVANEFMSYTQHQLLQRFRTVAGDRDIQADNLYAVGKHPDRAVAQQPQALRHRRWGTGYAEQCVGYLSRQNDATLQIGQ